MLIEENRKRRGDGDGFFFFDFVIVYMKMIHYTCNNLLFAFPFEKHLVQVTSTSFRHGKVKYFTVLAASDVQHDTWKMMYRLTSQAKHIIAPSGCTSEHSISLSFHDNQGEIYIDSENVTELFLCSCIFYYL